MKSKLNRRSSSQSPGRLQWLLLLALMGLTVLPLVAVRGEYSGTDGQAKAAIETSHPAYRPWARPLFQPASGEIEGLLFALQAALGAGVIGYVIGRYQERSLRRSEDDEKS